MPGTAAELLATLPDPPPAKAAEAAVAELVALRALQANEELTPLGQLLAQVCPPASALPSVLLLAIALGASPRCCYSSDRQLIAIWLPLCADSD